jgi:hypothetical protein
LTEGLDFSLGREALAYYNQPVHRPWGLKDPRLCVTLRFWMSFWTTPPAVFFIYRNPIEVAQSLNRRDNFTLPRGLRLWTVYSRLAIQNSQGLCRVITSYASILQDGPAAVHVIYEQLRACGVDVPRMAMTGDVARLIDSNLQHNKPANVARCHSAASRLLRSDNANIEKAEEYVDVAQALKVYCALEDGSAFSPRFQWEE